MKKLISPKFAKYVLLIIALLTVFLGAKLSNLEFNYDFNRFFPKNDSSLEFYEAINSEFGEYNNFLFVVLKSDEVFSSRFHFKAKSLIDSLQKWDEVLRIESSLGEKRIQITPLGINSTYKISPETVNKEKIDKNDFMGKFYGKDHKSFLFIIHHIPFPSKQDADKFYLRLDQYLNNMSFGSEVVVSGKTQMQYDFTSKLEKEMVKMVGISAIIVLIALYLIFGSLRSTILPLLALVITVVWTMGVLAWLNIPLDVMMVIVPAILLIIAISDVIHFQNEYDKQVLVNKKEKALFNTILIIGKANLLTSLTTAIGFISLTLLPIEPIQDFGLMVAVGVCIAFIVTITLLPAILLLTDVRHPKSRKSNTLRLDTFFSSLFQMVFRKRRTVASILIAFIFLTSIGIYHLKINTRILVGLQKNEPELKVVDYFDDNFEGYKPFEIGIFTESQELFDIDFLKALEELNDKLNEFGIRQVASPLAFIKELNSALNGGLSTQRRIPDNSGLNRLKRAYYANSSKPIRTILESKDQSFFRIIGRHPDNGSYKMAPIYKKVQLELDKLNSEFGVNAQVTGTSYLIDKTDQYVIEAILKGLGAGLLSISIILFLFFKSIRIVLAALVVNLVPTFLLAGIMGWLNIDLNIVTAVIFTVTFGIAVDDSIHLIARSEIESKGKAKSVWSIRRAFLSSGKSILTTSIILIAGFSGFLFSGLSAPFYIGLFVILSTIIALAFDLLLLPRLLFNSKN